MNLLTPQFAAIAAAVAIPSLLILYFLRLRRTTVEVSSTLLWKKAIEDLQANAPFQRLRRNILLFLQLLALLLALFALAQPQISANLSRGGKHIIMIDRSCSMQSIDGDTTTFGKRSRLEEAKRRALDLIEGLREPGPFGGKADEAMVIAFDLTGERLVNFTSNKAELAAAVKSIEASDTPSHLADAFVLAKAYSKPTVMENVGIVTGPPAVIHVYSDGRLPDAAQARPDPEDRVIYEAIGSPKAWNIGITALRAERSAEDPTKVSIFVGVQSTSPEPQSIDVELLIDSRTAQVTPLRLPAAKPEESGKAGSTDLVPVNSGVVFPIQREEAAAIGIQLRIPPPAEGKPGDALRTDDFAYFVLPPARRMAVALVTDGNVLLQALLTDDPTGTVEAFGLAKPVKLLRTNEAQAFIDSKEAAEYDVVILDRWLPQIEVAGKRQPGLPPGRTLAFGVTPALPLGVQVTGEKSELTIFSTWKRDHPALRGVNLESVRISKIPTVTVPRDVPVTVLADSTAGPAILEASDIDRRGIFTTFDATQSDWFYDPSFSYFVARSLAYFARGATADKANPLQPGETLSERLPRGASAITVTTPDQRKIDLVQASSGDINYAPIQKIGLYTVDWSGPLGPSDLSVGGRARRVVAANLLDAGESELATRPTLSLATAVVTASDSGQTAGPLNLWSYLLAACTLFLLLEWFIYNRKVSL